ncbi:MAG: methylmalonyl-CoA mutase family protein [Candidatus Krumholzibacteria bacterium]|jgi:methylmalonyl-CoA mutase|nr:methylmalonyl-CoA mutase family protein [Candidatus Krumholzibacteria bacterium]
MTDTRHDQAPERLGLREDFPVPSLDDWQQECVRLLKGVPFEKQMFTKTYEGITLQPLYTRAELAAAPHADSLPGQAPFVRGTRPLGYRERPWEVAQELPYPMCEQFNAALRHDLARGQTAAVLVIDAAGQAGLDPDQAPPEAVGEGGTSVATLEEMARALAGVDLARVPVHIESGSAALIYAALLVALAERQGTAPASLRGSVGLDPVAGLAELGRLPLSRAQAYDELAILTKWAAAQAPGLQTVAVRGHVYHDGGASAVQELAICLSVAVHHLRELERRGVDVETAAPRLRLHLSVGTQFFLEIARLRAARLLWARLIEAAGGSEEAQRLTLSARTSRFTKTVLDPHVNILRSTTEAMAAVFGQVDSLHVAPFDEPLGLPDELSRRLARNTQTILREESHFDLVADPAGGSWYVEKLTAEIAAAAWQQFQSIEAAGGVVAVLQAGAIQAQIDATAAQRRRNLALRKDVLVGTNQYPNAREVFLAPRRVDHAALAAERAGALQSLRTGGSQACNLDVLQKLERILTGDQSQVFAALIEAASAGATVGELSRTFRHDAEPHLEVQPVVAWRAGEMFERLRLAVRAHRDPSAATVFCANLGDVARYMPRLDFTRGFFQTGGFTVEADRWFGSPAEVADAAMQTTAATAVIVGLDATYAEQAAETARQLKDAGLETVILAGQPGELEAELRAAGVDQFIHLRSDAHAVLSELATSKGVAL